MMNVDLEKTKFFGLYAVWPLNHLLGMSKLQKPSPETPKKLKPGYTVRGAGDDPSNYFYILKAPNNWNERDCFG